MNRGALLFGGAAALLAVGALWLVFEARAPAPSTPVPPAAGNAAINTIPPVERAPAATGIVPPPAPAPAAADAGQRERVTTPLEVKLDEPRIAAMPRRLSGPAMSKIRYEYDAALREARARIAADRSPDDVADPILRAKDKVRELLSGPEPSDSIMQAMQSFDELEREARARAKP